MDGGWADYKRSLSGFSGFDSGVNTLKDKVYADKSKVFEMDKLNLGEEAAQVGQLKSTLDTVGESAGGLATTMLSMRSFGAMKKHLKNISDKIGGKETSEESGEKNSIQETKEGEPGGEEADAEIEAPTGEAGESSVEPTRSIQAEGEGDVVEMPEGGGGESSLPGGDIEMTDMRPNETEMTDMSGREAPEGMEQGTYDEVISDFQEGIEDPTPSMGQNMYHSSVADDPSSTSPFTRTPEDTLGTAGEEGGEVAGEVGGEVAGEVGGEVAADAAAVAADAAVGVGAQALDAIPIVGEIIGAVVGIGSAIAGGIEAGKEAADEKAETEDSKAELSIDSASSVANKFGNSVTPTLTSLAQMPSNAGVF